MKATLEKAKPYVFVHEADEEKGGATLAALQLEMQDKMQRHQLFDGRPVTQWHRSHSLQLMSLLQIAEAMLRASPRYQNDDDFSLYVPDGVHEEYLAFQTPLLLYASDNNTGAAEAAAEMQAEFDENLYVTSAPGAARGLHSKRTIGWRKFSLDVNANSSSSTAKLLSSTAKQLVTPLGKLGAKVTRFKNFGKISSIKCFGTKRSSSSTSSSAAKGPAPTKVTHFLLYLSKKTFVGAHGDALAQEVREALATGLPVVLVHETDVERDGCASFSTFFETSPSDLINSGLYNTLAQPFVSGEEHRRVSYALLAKKLGAQVGTERQADRKRRSSERQADRKRRSSILDARGAARNQAMVENWDVDSSAPPSDNVSAEELKAEEVAAAIAVELPEVHTPRHTFTTIEVEAVIPAVGDRTDEGAQKVVAVEVLLSV